MSDGEKGSKAVQASTLCRLLLMGHATAEGDGRFRGRLDAPLSRIGRKELPSLCRKCARHSVQAIYSSDLERARQTAEAVARKLGLKVEVRRELREMDFGEWEGLSWDEVARRHPRRAKRWMERFPHQTIPGGEPLPDFKKRVAAAVQDIVDANRGRCVLVVTHAGVIRFTLGRVLGLPAKYVFRLAQDPGAMNIIDYFESGAVVRCING